MLDILKKEWKLSMWKWFMAVGIATVSSFILGMFFLYLVMKLDKDSTFIYLGTFISFYAFAGIICMYVTNLFNERFPLLVYLGQKRSTIIKYMMLMTCGMGSILYAASMVLYLIEANLYPILYPTRMLNKEFTFSALPKYGLLIFLLVAVGVWGIYVLIMKFGEKAFAIACLGFAAVCLLLDSGIEANVASVKSVIGTVIMFFAQISKTGWILIGIAICVITLFLGYRVMKRHNVRV